MNRVIDDSPHFAVATQRFATSLNLELSSDDAM